MKRYLFWKYCIRGVDMCMMKRNKGMLDDMG